MAPLGKAANPDQFEIADLKVQPSDPVWPDAVRCVEMYWKQATSMIAKERKSFLCFLSREDLAVKLQGKAPNSRRLYDFWYDKEGNVLYDKLSWAGYLISAVLYNDLPKDYITAIEAAYGSLEIKDFTESYRKIYPMPKQTKVAIKSTSTSQPTDATPKQKCLSNPDSAIKPERAIPSQKNGIDMPLAMPSTGIQQQNATHTRSKAVRYQASVSEEENDIPSRTLSPLASPSIAQPMAPDTWNIGIVVDVLGQVKKKRLSSAPESSAKRVRVDDSKLFDQVNQQTMATQTSMDQLRSTVEYQGAKLQDVYAITEKIERTLDNMQSEMRQFFMLAATSTLRDIQERLEE
ncbi:hypothetical protein V8C42DRAFT_363135 [Trichoderma barbatum]